MNTTLAPLLRKYVIVFFDDILIYSATFVEHLVHLQQVLSLLQQDASFVKLSKCKFAQREISYLGHVISEKGVGTNNAKVEDMLSWPTLANIKELSFMGLTGYYRKFVKHFDILAQPLNKLLKRGVMFIWALYHDIAFSTLKQTLSIVPVSAMPNFSKTFCLETYACKNGVGTILLQDGHPIAFPSKPLGVKTQGLSTYEKEYLVVLIAVDH
jgi:hypothetical protein